MVAKFKGRTVMELPAAEIILPKGSDFRLAKGIVNRTHGHNKLDIVALEDGSLHRRHHRQPSSVQN